MSVYAHVCVCGCSYFDISACVCLHTEHVCICARLLQLSCDVSGYVGPAVFMSAVRLAAVFVLRRLVEWLPADLSGGQRRVASNHLRDLSAFVIDCFWS